MYDRDMNSEKAIELLKNIIETSGLSQEQIASRLGVSFATVNAWINGRSEPQKSKIERIKKLYLAQDSSSDTGPIYITLDGVLKNMDVGDEMELSKDKDRELDEIVWATKTVDKGLKPLIEISVSDSVEVANSKEKIVRGTYSAGRIYDKIGEGAKARVMFIFEDVAVAVITDFGIGFQ